MILMLQTVGSYISGQVYNLSQTVELDYVTRGYARFATDTEDNSGEYAQVAAAANAGNGFVSVKDFGAVGDGVADDTTAIQEAHSASKQVLYPPGTYLVSWPEGENLVSYADQTGIRVYGPNATIRDARGYSTGNLSAVFNLDQCVDVRIELNYEGEPISDKSNDTTGVGYRGATFVNMAGNCDRVTVRGHLEYLRYGVRGGEYSDHTYGENNNVTADLSTVECGYPVALYLTTGVDLRLVAEGSHRTAYLAGVSRGTVRAYFKNQYIAPIQVLLTDATTNSLSYPSGASRGCSDLDIVAHDYGSTTYVSNSFCAGISMSRGDAGTTFQNLTFDCYVKASDTVASKLGLFGLYNGFTGVQPSYPNEWEQTFYFRNIKVTGTLDRSAQTTAENSGNGEIYVYAYTSGSNYGTIQGIDFSGIRYMPGSGAKTRGFYFIMPGLVGHSSIRDCDFGTATPVSIGTNATSLLTVENTRMRGSYSGTSDSPFSSALSFVNCTIADNAYQPYANKTFYNTSIKSTKVSLVTRIIDSGALSGTTVTLTSAIPAGSVVTGVSAIVTTALTGATGFEIGVTGDTTRYANKFAATLGTTVTPITDSTETGPRNYASWTNLLITRKGSDFTDGAIRVAIHYLAFSALV